MEINNSYPQDSYQSKTSSTKKVDEVNSGGISNSKSFLKLTSLLSVIVF
jgi:hypothetical protein